jgi:hypothetical protein
MYYRTNRCYNERGSRTNYVRSSTLHSILMCVDKGKPHRPSGETDIYGTKDTGTVDIQPCVCIHTHTHTHTHTRTTYAPIKRFLSKLRKSAWQSVSGCVLILWNWSACYKPQSSQIHCTSAADLLTSFVNQHTRFSSDSSISTQNETLSIHTTLNFTSNFSTGWQDNKMGIMGRIRTTYQ